MHCRTPRDSIYAPLTLPSDPIILDYPALLTIRAHLIANSTPQLRSLETQKEHTMSTSSDHRDNIQHTSSEHERFHYDVPPTWRLNGGLGAAKKSCGRAQVVRDSLSTATKHPPNRNEEPDCREEGRYIIRAPIWDKHERNLAAKLSRSQQTRT